MNNQDKKTSLAEITKIAGIFATVVSVVIAFGGFLIECQSSKSKMELEKQRQKHETRGKYLDLALAEKSEAYEKGRILRFLQKIDDDSTIKNWADSESVIVEEYKAAKKATKDSIEAIAALDDSIKILSKNAMQYENEIKGLQKRRNEIKVELVRLNEVLDRTGKEAAIANHSNGVAWGDIQYLKNPNSPNCNKLTVRANTKNAYDETTCLLSMEYQAFDSVKYEKGAWRWVPNGNVRENRGWYKASEHEVMDRYCECQVAGPMWHPNLPSRRSP